MTARKQTILLATRNLHKVQELRRLLRDLPIRFLTLDHFPNLPPVREGTISFKQNGIKKAVLNSRKTLLPVLAEDSGLEVRALGGKPGIRSARFALRETPREWTPDQVDQANVRKLLREMKSIPRRSRQARFICVMAFAIGGQLIRTFEGNCPGSIALKPAGRTGFGYDPVFVPHGYRRTMSELGSRIKDRLSHRKKAAVKFREWFKTNL